LCYSFKWTIETLCKNIAFSFGFDIVVEEGKKEVQIKGKDGAKSWLGVWLSKAPEAFLTLCSAEVERNQ
jgi:hypothetical protein